LIRLKALTYLGASPYKNTGNIPLAWRTEKAQAPRLG
jgi:hypothetical protein